MPTRSMVLDSAARKFEGVVSLSAVLTHFHNMTTGLTEFSAREERQFFYVGERLGDFYTRAREVVEESEQAIKQLVQEGGGGALHELRLFLDSLESHIDGVVDEAHHHADSLSRLIGQLDTIEQPLQALAKVVKVLQALSFSTRVESTHGQSSQTLEVLSDNLKDLAAKINSKTDEVRDRLRAMSSLADKARERMQRLEGESLYQVRSTLHQSRHLLNLLVERRQAALDGATLLKQHSLDITSAIGEVVTAIQFHDITRQQVEHVRTALEEICVEFSQRSDEEIPRQALIDVCRVQAAQLRHTRSDLVTAVVRMIKNLNDITQSVTNLSRQTRIVAGAAESEGTTFFKEIEPVILSVTTMLQQSSGDNQSALVAVESVLDAMGELSLLLEQIELIGTEMKLIAFNAGITAAHNMERGAGLGVIADSIQTLSGQVMARTQEFAGGYHQMERLIRTLTDDGMDRGAKDDRGLAAQNRLSLQLIERMREMNLSLVGILREMDSNSLALGKDIQQVADSITIHVDAGHVIDELLATFDSLAAEFQGGNAALSAGGEEMLKRLSERYTMQSERDIHRRVSGGQRAAGFSRREKSEKKFDFGSNVELF